MNHIITTKNCPFSLNTWKMWNIRAVFAGAEAIMAITVEGTVLRSSTAGSEVMPGFWNGVDSISMSACIPGAAIGLKADGTCVSSIPGKSVAHWSNMRQVACSDGFFGLRRDGTVVCLPFRDQGQYAAAAAWRNVVRIVAGLQDTLYGITADGKVLVAGHCHSGVREKLTELTDVTDLRPTGGEGTELVYICKDGSVHCLQGRVPEISVTAGEDPAIAAHFWYSVLIRDAFGKLQVLMDEAGTLQEVSGWRPVQCFALGDGGDRRPFAIAVMK